MEECCNSPWHIKNKDGTWRCERCMKQDALSEKDLNCEVDDA